MLCYFEGRTYEEAARVLGCPAGTASARLARARELLRARLRLRGVTLSSSALVAWFAAETASAADACLLTGATVGAALRLAADHGVATLSSQVVAVSEGVVQAMLMRKLKTVAGLVLAATMTCVGAGILCRGGLITLAAAAGRPLQAADAGAVPSPGEPLFAVAADPPGRVALPPITCRAGKSCWFARTTRWARWQRRRQAVR